MIKLNDPYYLQDRDLCLQYICNGNDVDRTSSMPKSVLCLRVDKGQGLRSGIQELLILKAEPTNNFISTNRGISSEL